VAGSGISTRAVHATAESDNQWTVSTTASTSQIAADATRVGMLITSLANGRVYLRWDATAPTAANCHTFIDPGERLLVPDYAVELAVSMTGSVSGGTINSHWGLAV